MCICMYIYIYNISAYLKKSCTFAFVKQRDFKNAIIHRINERIIFPAFAGWMVLKWSGK